MTTLVKQSNSYRTSTCTPITEPGDLIQLNDHRIICGDSTKAEIVEGLLQNEKPNLMVTEPPYEINYNPFWKQKISSWNFPDNEFLRETWRLFPGNICYVWHSSLESSRVEKSLRDFDFECLYQIIWAKNTYEFSEGDYHWQHDACWYAVKKGSPHNWRGSGRESTLWSLPKGNIDDMVTIHPAQQHLECSLRPIRHNSVPGDSVYEPFCGSGSTLIACEQLQRRCFAVEMSPKFCDEVVKRWINFRKQFGKSHPVIRNGFLTEEYL